MHRGPSAPPPPFPSFRMHIVGTPPFDLQARRFCCRGGCYTWRMKASPNTRCRRPRCGTILFFALIGCSTSPAWGAKAGEGQLELTINDAETGKPIPCRIHLLNKAGKPRKVPKMPFWHDHFVSPGKVLLVLPRGNYTFAVEHGPEYVDGTGYFTINDFADDRKSFALKRIVDMAADNWFSGDLGIHRPASEIEALMQADDLHVAVLVGEGRDSSAATSFDTHRYFDPSGRENKAAGLGTLRRPKSIDEATGPAASLASIQAMFPQDAWIDLADPLSPDLPVYLALGRIDSFRLSHERFERTVGPSGPARPQKSPRPNQAAQRLGAETQEVYFHLLNCGFRIPPSAGSGSGVAPNPIGYNRMYVWVDKAAMSYEAWWEAVSMGRCVVTNGPLVRPSANGRLPGHVFKLSGGELAIDVAMNLSTRDPLTYVEVIRNGRVAVSVRLDEWAKSGHFPTLRADGPGWLLVRVVTDVPQTYRFAASAPWYIEAEDGKPFISRKSVQFFLDRLAKREGEVRGGKAADGALPPEAYAEARAFWQKQLEAATTD